MLDLNWLVKPISEKYPCGADIRIDIAFDSKYAQIKEERFLAKRIEREQSDESPKLHWKNIYDLSVKVLSEQSKDLQIVGWLIESAVRLYGFEGFLATVRLTSLLIESYWEQLYPATDEDGFEARIATFIGLNGESAEGALIFPLLNIPLTQGTSVPSFATWQCQHQQKSDSDDESGNNDIEISIQETPSSFFTSLFEIIKDSISELDKLYQLLTTLCENDAPSFNEIKKTLLACLSCLKTIAPNVSSLVDYSVIELDKTPMTAPLSLEKIEQISDRESAFQSLLEISNFFQRSEPHSPLPYLLRKAVRWGKMPLTDLLRELVEDQNILLNIYRLTGMEDGVKE